MLLPKKLEATTVCCEVMMLQLTIPFMMLDTNVPQIYPFSTWISDI